MKKILLLGALLCLALSVRPQKVSPVGPVAQKAIQLENTRQGMISTAVFERGIAADQARQQIGAVVRNATLLSLKGAALQQLLNKQEESLNLVIPLANGEELKLTLFRAEVTAPGFGVRTNASGNQYIPYEGGVHYRGIISGEAQSLAAISFFEEEVMGLIATGSGNLVLGRLRGEPSGGQHILYNDLDLIDHPERPACATPDDGGQYAPEDLLPLPPASKNGDCVNIYVEVDKDIYDNKGASVSNTVNWVTGLFNENATLYANENIPTAISEIFVWTSNSPYRGRSASGMLSSFQSERPGYNGDMGILINLKNAGGIAASIGGLCTGDKRDGMCYAGIESSYLSVPTYSYSVEMVSHELGHLFNSRHTHACVWNGNNTAIDGCYSVEGSCPRPGLPPGGGTIMSYCDFTSVGIDFSLGFGSQPGNVIRNYLAAANCTAACNSTCNNGIQDGDETGVDCGGSCPACGGPGGGTCDVPAGLAASSIRNNRATLSWSAVAGASTYTVQLRSAGSSTWTDGTASGTAVTASGLSRNTTYEWRVRANCSGSSSAFSNICFFTAGDANSGACGTNRPSKELEIFPNPAHGFLTVRFQGISEGKYTVADIYGRRLQTGKIGGEPEVRLDLSGLSAGIYFLIVQEPGGEKQSRRFAVE